jgi:WD40 repeat protein
MDVPEYRYRLTNLITWSPDGRHLVLPDREDIQIWTTNDWEETRRLEDELSAIYSLEWSSSNILVAVGYGEGIQIWNTDDWNRRILAPSDTTSIDRVAKQSPDGTILAVATTEIELWNIATGELLTTLPDQGALIYDLEWTPDGESLISRNRNSEIFRWVVEQGCIAAALIPQEG